MEDTTWVLPKITSRNPTEIAFNAFSDGTSKGQGAYVLYKIPHASQKRLCLFEHRIKAALDFKDLKSYSLKFKSLKINGHC